MIGATDPFPDEQIAGSSGASLFEFSVVCPELVVGVSSPKFLNQRNQVRDAPVAPSEGSAENDERAQASSGLPVTANVLGETEGLQRLLSINAGDLDDSVACGSTKFQRDGFFIGVDTIRTDAKVGEGKGLALYQTARFGNFSYKFPDLNPGDYVIILHLAEIVFTNGPPGKGSGLLAHTEMGAPPERPAPRSRSPSGAPLFIKGAHRPPWPAEIGLSASNGSDAVRCREMEGCERYGARC